MTKASFTEGQVDALVTLHRALPGRTLVLIGAAALGCHIEMTWRRTNDLDLTVVAELDEVHPLLLAAGFRPDTRLPYRFFSPTDVRFDVLPATPALLAIGTISFPGHERPLSLLGFDLALTHHHRVPLRDEVDVAVATAPTISVLKMTSYLDRPDDRERDLEDIGHLLDAYLDELDDRRFEGSLVEHQIDFEDQSAFALGEDIAAILASRHRSILTHFLDEAGDPDKNAYALLARSVGRIGDDREAVLARRLTALRLGLSSSSS